MIKNIQYLLVGNNNEEDLNRYARGVALYGLANVLNSVRCTVVIPNDNKDMPINLYGIFLGSSGIGKALRHNEKVLTPNGFVEIGSMKVGDYAIGSNGKPTKVLGVYPQGLRDIYEVKFFDDTTVQCDLEHIWTVYDRHSKPKDLTLKEILDNGYVRQRFDKRYGTYQKEYRYSIPYTPACEFGEDKNMIIAPYVLGCLLGDGGMTSKCSIEFTNCSDNISSKVNKLLPDGCELIINDTKNNTKKYHIRGSAVKKELDRLGLLGKRSTQKFIPKEYLYSSLKNRQALLQGLLDTDGHIKKNGTFEYSSSSKELFEDFIELCLSLGVRLGKRNIRENPKFTYKGETRIGATNYRISSRSDRSIGKSIKEIKKIGIDNAICIKVDAEDSLFVTNGFNLTHNTKSLNFLNDLILEANKKIREKANKSMEVLDPFNIEEIGQLTKDGITVADSYKSLTDSATLKLMRVMDITDYFSINYVVDEFASVVMREYEMLSSTIIEIYDKGKVPVNLRATSKTAKCENSIPLNMLAFGSSHLLFESDSNIEKSFLDLLQAGLARRTIFVNAKTSVNKFSLNANENRALIDSVSNSFIRLQDKYDHYKLQLTDSAIELYEAYSNSNTEDSINISDFHMLNKIYAKNRSWLALKISGLIACSKFENEVTKDSYQEAIDIIEDSYQDFMSIINRPQKYELIVDWLLDTGKSENEYTLTQALPFYKDIKNKKHFWDLAKGFAYENNITLMIEDKRNITFYQAKAKKKTNLEEPLLFSYSMDMAKDYYSNDSVVWKDFHKVMQHTGCHYSAHTFKDGHRTKDNAIEGFDLIMLDVDGGTPLEVAKLLLDNYTYLISTTRSHNKEKNGIVCDRYRIVLPMKNRLELDKDQYTKFMNSLMEDIPIELDTCTNDIARMFFASEGEYWYNEGTLFDADKYIPNTQEEEVYKKNGVSLAKKNISGISQYIIRNESSGRNQSLTKLMYLLIDKGYTQEEAKEELLRVNKQFNNPLAESELNRTIFKTLSRLEEVEVEDEEDEFASIDK